MNGATEDLEDSAMYLREALAYTTTSSNQLASCKQLLSTVISNLAALYGEDKQSNLWLKSHLLWRESVELTDPEASELLAQRLFELGKSASKIYSQTNQGSSEHVSEAAGVLCRAAATTSITSFRAVILFQRASVLCARFYHQATRDDFKESLKSGEIACHLTLSDESLVQQTTYWSGVYIHAYRLMRHVQESMQGNPNDNLEELEKIIGLFQRIIQYPHPSRQFALNHLGKAFTLLYHQKVRAGQNPIECMPSLERALESHEAALKAAPVNDIRISVCYTLLGLAHLELSRPQDLNITSRARRLDLAIEYLRQAIQKNSASSSAFTNLASALEDRYEISNQRQDLDECVSLLVEGTGGGRISHPKRNFKHAIHLVQLCHKHDLRNQLVPAYRIVFKALRRLSRLGLTSVARQRALEENSTNHACDAAASALTTGDPVSAIELLEEGRSLFFSQLLPTQIDSNRIRPLDPALASEIDETLDKIKRYSRETDDSSYLAADFYDEGGTADDIDEEGRDIKPESMNLTHYAQVFQNLLSQVRALPGYDSFMQLKPYHHLKRAAQHCPVVYVNISQLRCDALIIGRPSRTSEIQVVHLPTSWAKIRELSRSMQSAVRVLGREARGENLGPTRHFVRPQRANQSPAHIVRNVLKQLWDTVVFPVLRAMEFVVSSGLSIMATHILS